MQRSLGIIFAILPILYFKYALFFANSLNLNFKNGVLYNGLLPLGISFYTFQQITYLVDVYRRQNKHESNLIRYSFFVTFFPQLIAGPIVHYSELVPQIGRRLRDSKVFVAGLIYFAIGFGKKIVIADSLAVFTNPIFDKSLNGLVSFDAAITGALGYTFQLYFDFSGYSDMAVGLGMLFGFVLPRNFESPYQSHSISEFWRKWHMTLSRFLRDYVYILFGGSRRGNVRLYLNLLLTMLIGGLWHGAGWTFLAWGGVHGLALCINHLYNRWVTRTLFFGWSITFLFVVLAWVLFRAETFDSALNIYVSLLQPWNFLWNEEKFWIVFCIILIWFPNSHYWIARFQEKNSSPWESAIFRFGRRRLAFYTVTSILLVTAFLTAFYENMIDISIYRNLPLKRDVIGLKSDSGGYRSNLFSNSLFSWNDPTIAITGSSFTRGLGQKSFNVEGKTVRSGTLGIGGNYLFEGLRTASSILPNLPNLQTLVIGISPLNFYHIPDPTYKYIKGKIGYFKDECVENILIDKELFVKTNRFKRCSPHEFNFKDALHFWFNLKHPQFSQIHDFLYRISSQWMWEWPQKDLKTISKLDSIELIKNKLCTLVAAAEKHPKSVKDTKNGSKIDWRGRKINLMFKEQSTMLNSIIRLAKMSERNNVRLIFYETPTVTNADAPKIYPKGFLESYQKEIISFFNRENIEYYDFQQMYPWSGVFFGDFIHGTTKARKLTHEILLSVLYSKNDENNDGAHLDYRHICNHS
jgi:D-alanyl-lipoteichoic acid acyltransferase DltB (MBOAT superfamily)